MSNYLWLIFRIYGLPRQVISPIYEKLPTSVKEKLQEFLITTRSRDVHRLSCDVIIWTGSHDDVIWYHVVSFYVTWLTWHQIRCHKMPSFGHSLNRMNRLIQQLNAGIDFNKSKIYRLWFLRYSIIFWHFQTFFQKTDTIYSGVLIWMQHFQVFEIKQQHFHYLLV